MEGENPALRKFCFAQDFEVCFPTKNSAKIYFRKNMEMQKRMSDSKYKHSIYIVSFIQLNLPFSRKGTL